MECFQNLDRTLRRLNNIIFFNIGVLTSVLPALALMFIAVAPFIHPKLAVLKTLEPSPQFWPVILPAVNAVTLAAVVVYFGFYFWLEETQVTSCLLLSGHWYTYVLTTFCCVLVFVHLLCQRDKAPAPYHVWYGGWFAAYQVSDNRHEVLIPDLLPCEPVRWSDRDTRSASHLYNSLATHRAFPRYALKHKLAPVVICV